MSTEAYV